MSIEKNEIDYLTDAIKSLDPDAQFSVRGNDLSNINWTSTPIAQSDLDAEVVRLKALWITQEYARNRELEYPTVQELVVALYDEDDKAAIEAKRAEIKAKYPKP